jgi:hypothetical protein
MSRAEIVNAVIAKHDAPSGAEPAPDAPVAPPGGTSGAGSAPADVETSAVQSGETPASPGATIDHAALQAKLQHDRKLRQAKALRRKSKEESEAAAASRKEADEAKAKWTGLGKDKSWLEAVREAGHDPRKVYEEMQAEARKAGTPEAQLEAMGKAFEAKLSAALDEHVSPLKKTIEEITAERDELKAKSEAQGFVGDFQRALSVGKFQPLLEEYEPEDLFRLATSLRKNPGRLIESAKSLKVPLTSDDGSFSMLDIFNVMHATQAAHREKLQRRNQSAAPHTSQAGQQQPPQAKPPVNGTVERKAEVTTIGNDLAASSATEADKLKTMSRSQRVAYLAKKYG